MMELGRMAVVVAVMGVTLSACGASDDMVDLAVAPMVDLPLGTNEMGLQRGSGDHTLLRQFSSEELAAVELAKFAMARSHERIFRDYVTIQRDAHEVLYGSLQRVARQLGAPVSTVMSSEGAAQWSALTQLSGESFYNAYLDMQGPWQEHMLARLRRARNEAENSSLRAYAAEAMVRWGKDLCSLRALQGGSCSP